MFILFFWSLQILANPRKSLQRYVFVIVCEDLARIYKDLHSFFFEIFVFWRICEDLTGLLSFIFFENLCNSWQLLANPCKSFQTNQRITNFWDQQILANPRKFVKFQTFEVLANFWNIRKWISIWYVFCYYWPGFVRFFYFETGEDFARISIIG